MSFAQAWMSADLPSIATRSSRAGPTAFFAAASNASSTAVSSVCRGIPFSFSKYSSVASNSAFMRQLPASHWDNKKAGCGTDFSVAATNRQ